MLVAARVLLRGRARPGRPPERTMEQIREHYLIERSLADRLRAVPQAERLRLYGEVYDELFRRVPHHPQIAARFDGYAHRQRLRAVQWQARFLRRALKPGTVFMEVGAGDCALSLALKKYVERVYAIDVSASIIEGLNPPPNLVVALSDGLTIPVPDETVHVAFSDQLMEHLHPEDAQAQLANIYRSLVPGGVYFCVTPNRLYGPRDVSAYFDETATGLHLREYSARELRQLFLQAGFRKVRFYAGARGAFIPLPYALIACVERVLEALPYRLRKLFADTPPARALLGLRAAAVK
jgi:SAM-dependent methyltransferase